MDYKYSKGNIYLIHLCIFVFIGIFGILSSPIDEIFRGTYSILRNGSILITDYMYIGGFGATLLNSSITSLLILLMFKINKIKPNGSMIMSLWLILGFSMIGKNFLNIWPIILGVYIYSKIQKENFSNYILISVLSTALAPMSDQIIRILNLGFIPSLLISIFISIVIGIILPPICKFTLKIHQGYNLYNVGFANGLITLLFMSIINFMGIETTTNLYWSKDYKLKSIILIIILLIILIALGINKSYKANMSKIFKHSGRTVTDYYLMYNDSVFLNMGILGCVFLLYVLIIDGDLNGAVIALLFCIIGFGALGKHIFNSFPVSIGVILTSLISNTPLNTPSVILTTLGSTALAPITGQFGFIYGVIGGVMHSILMNNIGQLGGGINLYNNGFIAGMVVMILLPIIDGFKKGDI